MPRCARVPILAMVLILSGCIGWEEPRPYDDFVEEYGALLDSGQIPIDAGTDADASDAGVEVDASPFRPDPDWPDCSLSEAGEQVGVTFVNDTGIGGALYWVDPACNEIEVGLVQAGDELPQTTFVGHRFRLRIIRDDRRTVGGAYVSDAQTTRINLSGQP